MIVYAVVDPRFTDSPLGDVVETFMGREDAERFVDAIRREDPERGQHLRIVERSRETRMVTGGVGSRGGCLIVATVVLILLALIAWWWSTVDLYGWN